MRLIRLPFYTNMQQDHCRRGDRVSPCSFAVEQWMPMMETKRVILRRDRTGACRRHRALAKPARGAPRLHRIRAARHHASQACLPLRPDRERVTQALAHQRPKGTQRPRPVPVGTVGIMDLDWRNRRCEFGPIFIGELDRRGEGLAKDAEILVLDYCFNHLGLHKVIAHVTESNAAVIRP